MPSHSRLIETSARPGPLVSNNGAQRGHILLAVADVDVQAHVEQLLAPYYRVTIVAAAADAIPLVRRDSAQLALVDVVRRREDSGLRSAMSAGGHLSSIPVLVLAGDRDPLDWDGEYCLDGIAVVDPYDDLELLGMVGACLSSSLLGVGESGGQPESNTQIEALSHATLRETAQRYRQLVDSLPAAVYMCDAEGRITLFNQAAVELWGREPVIGEDQWSGSWQIFRSDGTQLPLEHCPMAVTLREDRPVRGEEIIVVRPDGTRRNVLPHPGPLHDASGQLIGAVNMLLDVTELRNARQRVHDHNLRINAIVNSVLEAIITICLDGTIESANDAAERMFGYTADEMIGRNVSMLMPAPFRDEHGQYLDNYLTSGVAKIIGIGREAIGVRKDGTEFPIDLAVTEVKLGHRRLFTGVVRDISERKEAERSMRDSEERFRTLTQNAPVAIFIKDLEGRYTLANPLACQALGKPDGVIGMTDHDLLPASIADRLRQRDLEVISTGEPGEAIEVVERDGFHADYLSVKFPLRNAEGEAIGVCGVATDITERRRAQEALRESQERFVRFMQHLPGLAWIKDLSGKYVYANDAASSAFQTSKDELYGKTDAEVFDPDTAMQFQENDQRAFVSAAGIQTVETLEHVDGVHHSLVHKFPIPGPDGSPTLVGGMAFDVTDQTQAEEALRESEERFRTLARHAPVGIFMSDRDGGTVFVNDSWCTMAGLTPQQARGSGWTEALHPEDRQRVVDGWRSAVGDGLTSGAEFRFMRPDGAVIWLQGNAVPLYDAAGGVTGYIGTVMDITERKQVEVELRTADRRKDEFLAMLAHELRNPLAPIRTGLELMRLAGDDHALIEDVRATMERQTQVMVRLIDDLLDVSRITRGTVELRKCRVELASVVQSAVETARPAIDDPNHTLTISLPKRPIVLDADPTRLAQIIANLLNNSAKYMEPGGKIELAGHREGDTCVLSVKDDGMGIPPDMLDRIFDLFTQVDRSQERPTGGSGLGIGLTLVQRLVEMHGGTVEARSPGLDQGSEFVIRLPVAAETLRDERSDGEKRIEPSGKRRILVADDNENAAELLAMLLRALGNDVRTAPDGSAALEVAAEFHPDIIFLDLGMPKLDGYETARRIRDQPWGKGTVLAALTGWGQEEDKRRTKEAGFNHHFVKPVEPASLLALLGN